MKYMTDIIKTILKAPHKKVNKLINKLPDINKLTDIQINNHNILHIAAIYGRKDIINKILDKYPDMVYISNSNGDTFVHLLAKYNHHELIKEYLIKYPTIIGFLNNNFESVVNIIHGNYNLLDWLIDFNKDIDVYNNLTINGDILLSQ